MLKDSIESGANIRFGGNFNAALNLPKVEAPGTSVLVSFPALMISLCTMMSVSRDAYEIRKADSRINLALRWIRTHAQDTVLTLKPDLDVGV